MRKFFLGTIICVFFYNCSFDNKTGIWTGSNQTVPKNRVNQNLELIFKEDKDILKEKNLSSEQKIVLDKPRLYVSWPQSNQNKFNNINNLNFENTGAYEKYNKISNSKVSKNIIINDNRLFFSDTKGNIGIFSFNENRLVYQYNFYKKKIKKTKKKIKLIIKDNLVIAADNFGYLYCLDYKKNKLIWAKNFLVPFRSNLKIINNVLILADEKNKIVLINIKNGKKIDELYTQPSEAVSNFESSFALDKNNNILFLSTNGTLYSMNLINNKKVNWIKNFKPENEIVFNARPIVISDDKILISTDNKIELFSSEGKTIWDLNIKTNILPIISGNTIFVISEDNYLLLINKDSGNIVFSKNIFSLVKEEYENKYNKKIKKIDNIFLIKNKLLLISNNAFFIELDLQNSLKAESIKKNSFDIASDIIFYNKQMIFVSNKKRIFKVN